MNEKNASRHKIVFMGDEDSGRWELVDSLLGLSSWNSCIHLISNIEVINSSAHSIEIWEIPMSFISELTMKDTEFICLCFDCSSPDGVAKLRSLYSQIPLELLGNNKNGIKIIIVGCNEDRLSKRVQEEAPNFMIEIENFFKMHLSFFDILPKPFYLSSIWESTIDEFKLLIAKIIEGQAELRKFTPFSNPESNEVYGNVSNNNNFITSNNRHKRKHIKISAIKRKAKSHDCIIM